MIDVTHMTPWPFDSMKVKLVGFPAKREGKETESNFEATDLVPKDVGLQLCEDPMKSIMEMDPKMNGKVRRAFVVIEGGGDPPPLYIEQGDSFTLTGPDQPAPI